VEQFNIAYQAAFEAWLENNDVQPLVEYMRSDQPLSPEERATFARLLDLFHFRSQPKGKGRPKGSRGTVEGNAAKSNKLAAFFAHHFRENWRAENPGRNIPSQVNDRIINAAISEVSRHSQGRRKADFETVKSLISKGKVSPI